MANPRYRFLAQSGTRFDDYRVDGQHFDVILKFVKRFAAIPHYDIITVRDYITSVIILVFVRMDDQWIVSYDPAVMITETDRKFMFGEKEKSSGNG